ncbi:YdcH family protein [Microbulbifer thermotolerans]|uniref:Uncharacterized protein n=1 Tax=Microbulbifer thermotolerans TaxID=252514 RepID=A0A143HJ76_MICTH|nr:DUF465 domain-containing protein [Microbulbifer thermotolerans]AMX01769.1 hypothetical protein A3224_03485 [Microbulbifer thermotolerans]MCX2779544.1 DUF465 domain-containing protein [Microbulbifer thermotolerans]MCX2805646.1 DUF465 domain-containing protein [Microbulbifer thermotolerans]MCX2830553.1 DUF465 domain-containing protein [Microbulbifer thermotolerans]MCX2834900.1 DUF465 domain-containing protein [Microbulbifer thermotolerans]
MPITAHTLENDFPEYEESIRRLKSEDLTFLSESREYERLDKEIRGLQDSGIGTDDEHYNSLKKQRAYLKQHLYHRIANCD